MVVVAVVGTALALTAMSLKDKQQANADADKMKQILASVHITATGNDVKAEFDRYIVKQFLVNSKGDVIPGEAFDVNVSAESKIADASQRKLPVYVCDLGARGTKYIIPAYGTGLWGPIWGYIAIDADGNTIFGAYFSHQSETPGLGAKIELPSFSGQFKDKHLFVDNVFHPISVVKRGQKPAAGEYVNGVSGGTITSKGVSSMLENCMKPYEAFLRKMTIQNGGALSAPLHGGAPDAGETDKI